MLEYYPNGVVFFIITVCTLVVLSQGQLEVGFYSKRCPNAESTVRSVVQEAFRNDPKTAAVLLRLLFHDCFVEGCDASILIDNGEEGELAAPGNAGVSGFDIIDEAKSRLEAACPGVVSCADIVALVARDAVSMVNGPSYEVPTGRRDGRISRKSLAANLPEVDDSIQLLKSRFREKGLNDKDLVLLSGGAHTVGLTACFFMQHRLYNFTVGSGSDPSINPNFLPKLKAQCPLGGDVNVKMPLDPVTEFEFDDQIFRNIKTGFAIIASDARLYDDDNTKKIVDSYARPGNSFKEDFAKAMVKMGNIGAKIGSQGEIRRNCRAIN